MNFTEVKDSGKREDFTTGSRRDSRTGKGRYDLLSPIVTERDAKHLENGAVKYGDRNWEKGQPLSRFLDSSIRHMNKYLEGHRDEDHLAAARWNIGAIIHIEEMIRRGQLPKELNDLPNYMLVPKPVKTGVRRFTPLFPDTHVLYWEYDPATSSATWVMKNGTKQESGLGVSFFLDYQDGYKEIPVV